MSSVRSPAARIKWPRTFLAQCELRRTECASAETVGRRAVRRTHLRRSSGDVLTRAAKCGGDIRGAWCVTGGDAACVSEADWYTGVSSGTPSSLWSVGRRSGPRPSLTLSTDGSQQDRLHRAMRIKTAGALASAMSDRVPICSQMPSTVRRRRPISGWARKSVSSTTTPRAVGGVAQLTSTRSGCVAADKIRPG